MRHSSFQYFQQFVVYIQNGTWKKYKIWWEYCLFYWVLPIISVKKGIAVYSRSSLKTVTLVLAMLGTLLRRKKVYPSKAIQNISFLYILCLLTQWHGRRQQLRFRLLITLRKLARYKKVPSRPLHHEAGRWAGRQFKPTQECTDSILGACAPCERYGAH